MMIHDGPDWNGPVDGSALSGPVECAHCGASSGSVGVVERVAAAIYKRQWLTGWDEAPDDDVRSHYRDLARAAMAATKEHTMSQYRKKPVVIEAMQFDGNNQPELAQWMQSSGAFNYGDVTGDIPERQNVFYVHTLEGTMMATAGDWIIRGVQGDFYPCKPDIFAATYEPVSS